MLRGQKMSHRQNVTVSVQMYILIKFSRQIKWLNDNWKVFNQTF